VRGDASQSLDSSEAAAIRVRVHLSKLEVMQTEIPEAGGGSHQRGAHLAAATATHPVSPAATLQSLYYCTLQLADGTTIASLPLRLDARQPAVEEAPSA
jgi:hypothetical protein